MSIVFMPLALDGFLEACPLATVVIEPNGLISEWNHAAEDLLGWTREEAIGRPASALLLNLNGEMASKMLATSGKGAAAVQTRKDGLSIRVMLWTATLTDAGTGASALLYLFSDAQDQHDEHLDLVEQVRETQQQLRDMNRFKELLEAAPDAIIEIDSQGRILLMNAITEKLFGFSRSELLGQPIEILLPEDLRMAHEEHRQRYAKNAQTRPMGIGLTLSGKRKDGSRLPVEISLSPSKSAGGLRITAIIRDVSERKRAEERLQEVRDKFTAELSAANRLKSEFLASMSHELRTPLHTIMGFAELLAEELEGPLTDKQKRFVHHIQNDSSHLLELINDILDLSKIEAGRLDLHAEEFDASGALEEVLASIMPLAATKTIAIKRLIDAPQTIKADRVRFKQILYNLLSNAVKFTPSGGRISIECFGTGSVVRFSVRDTGIGIPASEHSAIFDKFHQVGSTTKGVREGTGLGLAITRHLVESHGGRIWVESREGKGSCFHFTVPGHIGELGHLTHVK